MEYIFQSERLGFRKWKEADLIPFCEMNSDKDVMEFFPSILSKLDSIKFADKINEQFLNYGYGLYAVEELKTTQFIGFIGFWHPSFELKHSPFIEIGWRIRKEYWNRGYATEGAVQCLNYGFNHLNFQKIYSLTSKINLKSIRVMNKIGMTKLEDFQHPNIQNNNKLKPHVLYVIEKSTH